MKLASSIKGKGKYDILPAAEPLSKHADVAPDQNLQQLATVPKGKHQTNSTS